MSTKGLLQWTQRMCSGYDNVQVSNFTHSWKDGLAFCALVHRYCPEHMPFASVTKSGSKTRSEKLRNHNLAFRVAEEYLGVPPLLDAEDMLVPPYPEKLSVITYLSTFHMKMLNREPAGKPPQSSARKQRTPGRTTPRNNNTPSSSSSSRQRMGTPSSHSKHSPRIRTSRSPRHRRAPNNNNSSSKESKRRAQLFSPLAKSSPQQKSRKTRNIGRNTPTGAARRSRGGAGGGGTPKTKNAAPPPAYSKKPTLPPSYSSVALPVGHIPRRRTHKIVENREKVDNVKGKVNGVGETAASKPAPLLPSYSSVALDQKSASSEPPPAPPPPPLLPSYSSVALLPTNAQNGGSNATPAESSWMEKISGAASNLFERAKEKAGFASPPPIHIAEKSLRQKSATTKRPQLLKTVAVADMSNLPELSVTTMCSNLSERFAHDLFYTKCSDILVSVNPNKPIAGMYTNEMQKMFVDGASTQPHIYGLGAEALRQLRATGKDQSVVVSGESGAGKTEAVKLLVSYISSAAGGSSLLQKRLHDAGIVLEAFGNARTVQNANSSRFGKYFRIYLDSNGSNIVRADVTHYLLEVTRVTSQQPGERNFHAFYQMCAGEDNFGAASDFLYTSSCTEAGRREFSDAAQWRSLKDAMVCLGFSSDTFEAIKQTLAAILYLGNVSFASGKKEVTVVKDRGSLHRAAMMLGVDPQLLGLALTHRLIGAQNRDSVARKPLTVQQAIEGRDALARCLYQRLFDFLVTSVNNALAGDSQYSIDDAPFIGLLDIFGFENLRGTNSLEQLMINYANEKLQYLFVDYVFRADQEELAQEGIHLNTPYPDNSQCVSLFEDRSNGLIAILDDECRLDGAAPRSFVERANDAWGRSGVFSAPPLQRPPQFTVNHYAEPVAYNASDLKSRNQHSLRPELAELLSESRWKPQGSKTTVGREFKNSLADLNAGLRMTTVHFIRCIRPSNDGSTRFDAHAVSRQLAYLGMPSVAEARKHAYPYRLTFEEFQENFGRAVGLTHKVSSGREISSVLTNLLGVDAGWTLGITKVLFSQAGFNVIQEMEYRRREAELEAKRRAEQEAQREAQMEAKRQAQRLKQQQEEENRRAEAQRRADAKRKADAKREAAAKSRRVSSARTPTPKKASTPRQHRHEDVLETNDGVVNVLQSIGEELAHVLASSQNVISEAARSNQNWLQRVELAMRKTQVTPNRLRDPGEPLSALSFSTSPGLLVPQFTPVKNTRKRKQSGDEPNDGKGSMTLQERRIRLQVLRRELDLKKQAEALKQERQELEQRNREIYSPKKAKYGKTVARELKALRGEAERARDEAKQLRKQLQVLQQKEQEVSRQRRKNSLLLKAPLDIDESEYEYLKDELRVLKMARVEDILRKKRTVPESEPVSFAENSSPVLETLIRSPPRSAPANPRRRLPSRYARQRNRIDSPTNQDAGLDARLADLEEREKRLADLEEREQRLTDLEKREAKLRRREEKIAQEREQKALALQDAKRNRSQKALLWEKKQQQFYKDQAKKEAERKKEQYERIQKLHQLETGGRKPRRDSDGQQLLYGLDAELHSKISNKYDSSDWQEAITWIERILNERITGENVGEKEFYRVLRSGVVLCDFINMIVPGMIPRINPEGIALAERENVQLYINATVELGVPSHELFVVSDLYDKKYLPAVLTNLHALSRAVQRLPQWDGPILGVKVSKAPTTLRKWNIQSNTEFYRQ